MSDFLKDSDDVIRGLESALAALKIKKDAATASLRSLQSTRKLDLQKHVERLLLDTSDETLAHLRQVLPSFCNASIMRQFQAARYPKSSFWDYFLGRAAAQKIEREERLDMLRVKLGAAIDALKIKRPVFKNLADSDTLIVDLQEQIADLSKKGTDLIVQIIGLRKNYRQAEQQRAPIPAKVAQAMSASASSLRQTQSSSSRDENMNDLIILWATGVPTSMRTLMLEPLFNHHDQAASATGPVSNTPDNSTLGSFS